MWAAIKNIYSSNRSKHVSKNLTRWRCNARLDVGRPNTLCSISVPKNQAFAKLARERFACACLAAHNLLCKALGLRRVLHPAWDLVTQEMVMNKAYAILVLMGLGGMVVLGGCVNDGPAQAGGGVYTRFWGMCQQLQQGSSRAHVQSLLSAEKCHMHGQRGLSIQRVSTMNTCNVPEYRVTMSRMDSVA